MPTWPPWPPRLTGWVSARWGKQAGVLGLPGGIQACLFDLDGVLTRIAAVHAAAWKEMFDEFLRQRLTPKAAPSCPLLRTMIAGSATFLADSAPCRAPAMVGSVVGDPMLYATVSEAPVPVV